MHINICPEIITQFGKFLCTSTMAHLGMWPAIPSGNQLHGLLENPTLSSLIVPFFHGHGLNVTSQPIWPAIIRMCGICGPQSFRCTWPSSFSAFMDDVHRFFPWKNPYFQLTLVTSLMKITKWHLNSARFVCRAHRAAPCVSWLPAPGGSEFMWLSPPHFNHSTTIHQSAY